MDKKLDIVKLVVNENDASGFNYVALVDQPAIMLEWLSFAEQKKPYRFEADEKRRILTGPLMIPDLPIKRVDEKTGREFYVQIDADTNEIMMKKFMKNKFTNNINIMHDPKMKINGNAYFMEVWMSDEQRGVKPPEAFKDLPNKTIFGSVYFENKEMYEETVTSGLVKGFSIEGWFHESIMGSDNKKDIIHQIKEILAGTV